MNTQTRQAVPPPSSSSELSSLAARISRGAIVTYQVLLFALILLRPELDPSWHMVSEWALGRLGWLMSIAFVVSASSYASLFVLLKSHAKGWQGRLGLVLLLICVVGTTGVGLCTMDPPETRALSLVGTLHVVFGASALALLPFAALFLNLSLALKNEAWAPARKVLLWTAALPLFGFAGFAAYTAIFVAPLGEGAYGPGVHLGWPPRIALLTYMVWIVILTTQALRIHRGARPVALPGLNTARAV